MSEHPLVDLDAIEALARAATDASFLVAARAGVPWLVAEVRRLRLIVEKDRAYRVAKRHMDDTRARGVPSRRALPGARGEGGMLTVLPCGGLGELDPKGATMRIVCSVHISWEHDERGGFASRVIGLAYISESRPLVREDLPRSFFWAEGKHAWLVEHVIRFARPLTLAELDVYAPPQAYVWVPGATLRNALTGEAIELRAGRA